MIPKATKVTALFLFSLAMLVAFVGLAHATPTARPSGAHAALVAAPAPLMLADTAAAPAASSASSLAHPPIVVVDPGTSPGGFFGELLDAAKTKDLRAIIVLVLVGLVWAVRKFVPADKLKGDRAGALLALGLGIAGSFITTLAAGAPITPQLILDGLMIGATAAGGWTVVKKIIWPADAPAPDTGAGK